MKLKTRVPDERKRGVVYDVPCKECRKTYCTYVEERKRMLRVRLGEHKQAVKKGNSKNGIAVHGHENQHEINWNGAEEKKMEATYWKRRTFEAIQIKASGETKNLDSGLQLSSVWNPIWNPSGRNVVRCCYLLREAHQGNSAICNRSKEPLQYYYYLQ